VRTAELSGTGPARNRFKRILRTALDSKLQVEAQDLCLQQAFGQLDYLTQLARRDSPREWGALRVDLNSPYQLQNEAHFSEMFASLLAFARTLNAMNYPSGATKGGLADWPRTRCW
jgi:hypothetical protein